MLSRPRRSRALLKSAPRSRVKESTVGDGAYPVAILVTITPKGTNTASVRVNFHTDFSSTPNGDGTDSGQHPKTLPVGPPSPRASGMPFAIPVCHRDWVEAQLVWAQPSL